MAKFKVELVDPNTGLKINPLGITFDPFYVPVKIGDEEGASGAAKLIIEGDELIANVSLGVELPFPSFVGLYPSIMKAKLNESKDEINIGELLVLTFRPKI